MLNQANLLEILVVIALAIWVGVALLRRVSGATDTPESISGTYALATDDDDDSDEEILNLKWLSKTDAIESNIIVKVSDGDDVDWDDGILTALSPDDKRIVLTCPPRSALVYCAEQTPTDYEDVEYLLTLKDGDTTLGEWKVYADSDGPNLEGNYWWATDDDGKTQFMIFAGRELTLIAREV